MQRDKLLHTLRQDIVRHSVLDNETRGLTLQRQHALKRLLLCTNLRDIRHKSDCRLTRVLILATEPAEQLLVNTTATSTDQESVFGMRLYRE